MADPNCTNCNGRGVIFQGGVFDGQQVGGHVPCPCTPPEPCGLIEGLMSALGVLVVVAGGVFFYLRSKGLI